MSKKRSIPILPALFLTILTAQPVPSEYVGHWVGSGKEIVTWCQADTIPFDLEIHPDGSVTGTVGDAEIHGCFCKNGWLGCSPQTRGCVVAPTDLGRGGLKRGYLNKNVVKPY